MIAIIDLNKSHFIHCKFNAMTFDFALIEAIIIKLMFYVSIIRRAHPAISLCSHLLLNISSC